MPQFPLLYHEDNKFLTILVRSYEVAKCFSIASLVLISKFSGVRCRSVLLARHWVRWVCHSFFLWSGEEPQWWHVSSEGCGGPAVTPTLDSWIMACRQSWRSRWGVMAEGQRWVMLTGAKVVCLKPPGSVCRVSYCTVECANLFNNILPPKRTCYSSHPVFSGQVLQSTPEVAAGQCQMAQCW